MDKLLPCPHCNGPAEWSPGNYKGIPTCQHCRSTSPNESTWNRRAQPEVAGWQPIETAPKDGELVCVWSWRDGRFFAWWKESAGTWMTVCDKEVLFAPTLWFDVPEPPAAIDRARKGGE